LTAPHESLTVSASLPFSQLFLDISQPFVDLIWRLSTMKYYFVVIAAFLILYSFTPMVKGNKVDHNVTETALWEFA